MYYSIKFNQHSLSQLLSGQPDEAIDEFCKYLNETKGAMKKSVRTVEWSCYVGRKWLGYEENVW